MRALLWASPEWCAGRRPPSRMRPAISEAAGTFGRRFGTPLPVRLPTLCTALDPSVFAQVLQPSCSCVSAPRPRTPSSRSRFRSPSRGASPTPSIASTRPAGLRGAPTACSALGRAVAPGPPLRWIRASCGLWTPTRSRSAASARPRRWTRRFFLTAGPRRPHPRPNANRCPTRHLKRAPCSLARRMRKADAAPQAVVASSTAATTRSSSMSCSARVASRSVRTSMSVDVSAAQAWRYASPKAAGVSGAA